MQELGPVERRVILHWGEMGPRWGVNRTVAQIHALLYVTGEALDAEEIARALSIARSNVSTSIKELEGWGIVQAIHTLGDRRRRFAALADPWETLRVVLEERKRREMDPTLVVLRQARSELADDPAAGRIDAMLQLFETVNGLFEVVRSMPAGELRTLAQLDDGRNP
jgi:DNA-binding transcriptional regulator GbsR (MarR family)